MSDVSDESRRLPGTRLLRVGRDVAVARRLTRDAHEAEDLIQDSLALAYKALDHFDGRYPRAWLLTILRNPHDNRLRKRTPDRSKTRWHSGFLTRGGWPADGRRLHRARAKVRAELEAAGFTDVRG